MVPSGSRSVSKLALNVGPDGLKLAFPQGVAPGSSGSAASAIQVIPATLHRLPKMQVLFLQSQFQSLAHDLDP